MGNFQRVKRGWHTMVLAALAAVLGCLVPFLVASMTAQTSPATAQDTEHYFDAITPTAQGYLIWPEGAVQIYVEPASEHRGMGEASSMQQRWQTAVQEAIADWSKHLGELPIHLEVTGDREQAQIRILRSAPPLRWTADGPRARNAETRFQIVWSPSDSSSSAQRCFRHQQTIFLSDRQGSNLLRGTARHELGHALGLWGHSPNPNDALYMTQVGSPTPISPRDLNTLKLVYQQPNQLRCLDAIPGVGYGPQ